LKKSPTAGRLGNSQEATGKTKKYIVRKDTMVQKIHRKLNSKNLFTSLIAVKMKIKAIEAKHA
jgi:hypothetical protein